LVKSIFTWIFCRIKEK